MEGPQMQMTVPRMANCKGYMGVCPRELCGILEGKVLWKQ